jgi:hypothetical protein
MNGQALPAHSFLFIWGRKNKFGEHPADSLAGHIQYQNNLSMKKIGILHGKERSFPEAFVDRVNSKQVPGIVAEPVKIDKAMQGEYSGY